MRSLVPLVFLLLASQSVAAAADTTTMLWFDQPAGRFQQSLPLGNGALGAMVFGGVREERIVLNENSMWSGSREDADRPEAHQALPEIRRLLVEGKNVEAERLVNANFTCRGKGSGHGRGANVPFGCYQTLGNLRLKFGSLDAGPRLHCASGHRAWSADQEIESATDGNEATKWCIIHEGRPVVWQFDAGQPGISPREYRLTSAEDVPARDPRSWKLEGSNDGVRWSMLDECKDVPVFAKRHETRVYRIARPGVYRFFRFTFLPNPGVSHFQVAEIALEGVKFPPPTARVPPEEYRRTLDLRSALAQVTYREEGTQFTREHFISAPDEVFVSRMRADQQVRCRSPCSWTAPSGSRLGRSETTSC